MYSPRLYLAGPERICSFYRVIATALGSRLILNLHGSILRPSHTEALTVVELDTVILDNLEGNPTTTRDSVEYAENPEGAA